MTRTTLHPLAADYLKRLRRAGRRLPRESLRDLVADVEAHLAETTEPASSDADVLTVLDRLGAPEEIVAAQRPELPDADRRGSREWGAIILLLAGGFIAGIGWLAGVVLLWSSRAWNTRDKLIGTLVLPGGLCVSVVAVLFLGAYSAETCSSVNDGPEHCTGGLSMGGEILSIALWAFLVIAPMATAFYLARRAR
jgi:hypothetical protein